MKRNGKYLLVPSMVWLAVFFVIPMLIVVAVSFASRTAYGQIVFGWTFQNYARFLDPLYISIFGRTIFIAVVTTVCTILMGYPLAYCIAWLPRHLRQKGLILCMIPFWINFLIRSYAWVIILRSQGVLNTILMKLEVISQPIQFLYNEGAVMLGMVYALLPFMILPVYVSIEQLDRRLLEAAADLGASPMTAFRKITLPATGLLARHCPSCSPCFPSSSFSCTIGRFRRRKETAMQKTWRSHLLLSYALAVLAFLYLPILILTLYSFNDSRMNAVWAGLTFKWYVQLFNNRHVAEALTNTLIIGFISTAVSTILVTTAAIALHKYRYKWQGLLNGLIYLPILIPEIVMGLSLLVLFSQIHLSLGRTSIILAHITFCLSFVVITVGARLDGLKQEYEEAAGDLYARPWQCFRYITLPLIMPGITAGALIAFTLSIDDFIISFFAAGPNSTTLPLYIYAMVKRGISPEINALSTLMIAAEIALVLLADFFQIRQAGTGRKKELPDDRQ